MKKNDISLALAAIALVGSIPAFANGKGNGGDWYGFHYSNIAKEVVNDLFQLAKYEKPLIDPNRFMEAVKTTSVESLPKVVVDGRERDAYTFETQNPPLTQINRNRWHDDNDSEKLRILLHEYSVVLGLEKSDQYYVSMRQADRLERLIKEKSIPAIDFDKFSPEERARLLLERVVSQFVPDLSTRGSSFSCGYRGNQGPGDPPYPLEFHWQPGLVQIIAENGKILHRRGITYRFSHEPLDSHQTSEEWYSSDLKTSEATRKEIQALFFTVEFDRATALPYIRFDVDSSSFPKPSSNVYMPFRISLTSNDGVQWKGMAAGQAFTWDNYWGLNNPHPAECVFKMRPSE